MVHKGLNGVQRGLQNSKTASCFCEIGAAAVVTAESRAGVAVQMSGLQDPGRYASLLIGGPAVQLRPVGNTPRERGRGPVLMFLRWDMSI